MSINKINKCNLSDFYDHKNRYIVNDINTIISFYRLGNKEEIEPIDLVRMNFLLTSKLALSEEIHFVKKNILITNKFTGNGHAFCYNATELDLFGNKLNRSYSNIIPNANIKNKIFPAIYYCWDLNNPLNKEINKFIDMRYLIAILNRNKIFFKESLNFFNEQNLLFKIN